MKKRRTQNEQVDQEARKLRLKKKIKTSKIQNSKEETKTDEILNKNQTKKEMSLDHLIHNTKEKEAEKNQM